MNEKLLSLYRLELKALLQMRKYGASMHMLEYHQKRIDRILNDALTLTFPDGWISWVATTDNIPPYGLVGSTVIDVVLADGHQRDNTTVESLYWCKCIDDCCTIVKYRLHKEDQR